MGEPYTVCVLTDECIHTRVCASRRRRVEIQARGRLEYPVPNTLLAEHDTEELAEAIVQAVKESGSPMDSMTLVLPLQWCFTHVVTSPGRKTPRQSLAYDFEQYLPLPLEEVTCAFVPITRDRVLAAAVPTQPMTELLSALAERGVAVERLAVDAVTAADAFHSSRKAPGVIILDARWARMAVGLHGEETSAAFAFALNSGQPISETISEHLGRRFPESTPGAGDWPILHLSGSSSGTAPPSTVGDRANQDHHIQADEGLDAMACALASSPSRLDLRVGPLAAAGRWDPTARLARQCMVCILALTLVWTGGMYLCQRSLLQDLTVVNQARSNVYTRVFDTDRLPPGAAMHIASERIRLEGLTLTSAESVPPTGEATPSAVRTLRNVVAALPEDVRVMLLTARIDGTQMNLHGQTAEHRDAERIVEAINTVSGFSARPPRTSRLRTGGVEFSILATTGTDDEKR